jgi:hypothetical protein
VVSAADPPRSMISGFYTGAATFASGLRATEFVLSLLDLHLRDGKAVGVSESLPSHGKRTSSAPLREISPVKPAQGKAPNHCVLSDSYNIHNQPLAGV